jgi:hypothetical protein
MRQAVGRGPEPRTATPDGSGGTVRGVRRRFRRRPTPAARWPRPADTDRTARPASRNRHCRGVRPPSTRPAAGHHTARHLRRNAAVAAGRRAARVRTLTGDAARVVDTCCPQRGQRTGRCPLAQRPAAMTVEAAAEGPQRFRPGGGNGTGCRTPDRSRSHPAWTPCPPARRRGRTGQDAASSGRSIRRLLAAAQPPLAPTRYNVLYILKGRPCGRPPAAAVLGRLHHTTGSVYRSHRPDAPRS